MDRVDIQIVDIQIIAMKHARPGSPDVTVHPTQVHVKKNDERATILRWVLLNGGKLQILPSKKDPKHSLVGDPGEEGIDVITWQIPGNMRDGTYQYAVHAETNLGTIDIPNCPEIIIE